MKGFRKLGEPLFSLGLTQRLAIGSRHTAGGDTTAPTVTITCDQSSPTPATSLTFTYTWSEDVTGFETGDAGIVGGTKGTFTAVDASHYTLAVTVTAATITATVAAGVCVDAAGNANAEATPLAITSTILFYDTFTRGRVPGRYPT